MNGETVLGKGHLPALPTRIFEIQLRSRPKVRPMFILTLLPLLTSSMVLAPSAIRTPPNPIAPATVDAADEAAQYIAGLYQGQLFELTVKEATVFLKKNRRHPAVQRVRYQLASALFELNQTEKATPHFRELAADATFEYRAEILLRLGQCELQNGRPTAAREALAAALAADQDYLIPIAGFFMGEAEFQLENFPAAREHYELCLPADAAQAYHAHAMRGLAWCSFREGDWSACRAQAQNFLTHHGQHELAPEVRFLNGDAAFQSNAHDAAEAIWKTIEAGPWWGAALRGRAWIQSKRGNDQQAAILFARVLEAEPEGRFAQEAALQCGVHLLRAGNVDDALRVFELPAAGTGVEVMYWRAKALGQSDRKQAALTLLQRTLSDVRQHATDDWRQRLLSLRADLLFDLGRLDEAAASYQADGSEYGLHAGSTASLNAGQPQKALELAEQFLSQFPDSPYRTSTLRVRAEAHFALGEHQNALADFASLLEMPQQDPAQTSAAQSRLAWCHYLLGNRAAAAMLFAKVRPGSIEAQEAHYMHARVLAEDGKEEAAGLALKRYLESYPAGEKRPEVLLRMGRLTGNPDALRRLLQETPQHALAATARVELAALESAAGRPQAALEHYATFLEQHPDHPLANQARYSFCWELRGTRQLERASSEIAALLARNLQDELLDSALELGIWIQCEQQDPAGAQRLWKRFSTHCEDEARLVAVTRVLKDAWRTDGKDHRARQLLRSLVPLLRDPGHSLDLLLERVWLAIETSGPKDADPLIDLALQESPQDARVLEACFFWAETCFAQERFPRAATLYASAANPENAGLADKALYKLGFTQLTLGAADKAADSFEELIKDYPQSDLFAESLYLAGEARFRQGQMQAAATLLRRFQRDVRHHAARPKALHRLGLAANALQQYEIAYEALTELLTSAPQFEQRAEARYGQGFALMKLERKRAARSAFGVVIASALESKQDSLFAARARIALGHMDVAENDLENALSHFLKVSLLYADGKEVREAKFNAAQVLEAQGRTQLAVKSYRELKTSAPQSPQGQRAAQRLRDLGL